MFHEDLSKLQKITLQDANIVILTMMLSQVRQLIGEDFVRESKIAPDNLQTLLIAKEKQIEILSSNLKFAKDRNK